MAPLTLKQRKFIELYDGNGTDAARKAGYGGDDRSLGAAASRLLKDVRISQAIGNRPMRKVQKAIATREERQAFWTEVLQDTGVEMRDRLKASELLGRSNADFTEKIAGADGGPVAVSVIINRVAK